MRSGKEVPESSIEGSVKYKRYPSHDEWTTLSMVHESGKLTAFLPQQPSAGKMIYFVYLSAGGETVSLSGEEPVTIR